MVDIEELPRCPTCGETGPRYHHYVYGSGYEADPEVLAVVRKALAEALRYAPCPDSFHQIVGE